jgi:hypothetical protein
MPEINNVHVYTDTQPPVLVISQTTAFRTLAGSYVDVHGQTRGAITVGAQYRITEGGPYDANSRPGVVKTCNKVNEIRNGIYEFT